MSSCPRDSMLTAVGLPCFSVCFKNQRCSNHKVSAVLMTHLWWSQPLLVMLFISEGLFFMRFESFLVQLGFIAAIIFRHRASTRGFSQGQNLNHSERSIKLSCEQRSHHIVSRKDASN